MNQLLQQPFIQVALPILIGFFTMGWINNSRLSDMNRRIDELRADMNRQFGEIIKRLDRIETKFDDHETRITRVEERTSPIGRR